jgi:hypothetical protein
MKDIISEEGLLFSGDREKAGERSGKRTQKPHLWHSGILVRLCAVHQVTGMAENLPAG